MTSAGLLFVVLAFMSLVMDTKGFMQQHVWKENATLIASIRVSSFTVFSAARCLGECLDRNCTLLTLVVTKSNSSERIDCHLTKVTDWFNKSQVYLEPCNQSTQISCRTFVATQMPHIYFPLDGANQLRDLGSLHLPNRNRTLVYRQGSQSGNPFTCTGPSGNPQVKYLYNNLDTNNYLYTDLNEQWQPTGGFTLALWIMFYGSPTSGPLLEFCINNQFTAVDDHFWFWSNPAQPYYNNVGVTNYFGPVMSMTPGQWYHVAMTWRPGGELMLYWNATQVYKTNNGGTTMAGFQPSYMLVGARNPNERMLACLAHVVVHSETMSQLQLQQLMLAQMTFP